MKGALRYVQTDAGLIPMIDYLEIRARMLGFASHQELRDNGYRIIVPKKDIREVR